MESLGEVIFKGDCIAIDYARNMVIAEDEWWERKIKENKEYRKYRYKDDVYRPQMDLQESSSDSEEWLQVFPSLTFDLRDGFSKQVDRQGTVTIRFRGSWTGSRLALTECRYDEDAAVEFLNNNPGFLARPVTVVRAVTSTGSRVLAPTPIEDRNPANVENGSDSSHGVAQPIEEFKVKKESAEDDVSRSLPSQTQVQESTGNRKSSWEAGYEEFLKASNTKVISEEEYLKSTVEQPPVQASVDKVSEKKQVATPDSGEVKIVKEVGSFPCFQKSSQWTMRLFISIFGLHLPNATRNGFFAFQPSVLDRLDGLIWNGLMKLSHLFVLQRSRL
ncbi:hypothetical protein K1719_009386 [Acacia pycnantha]|nr:hypothetical protein K1719_009386 [Acacia pycnantha]